MEPISLFCSECYAKLGRHALIAECGHAFCYAGSTFSQRSCVSTTKTERKTEVGCPSCGRVCKAWIIGAEEDAREMPLRVRELLYARISMPVTGISGAALKRKVEIVLRRRAERRRYLERVGHETGYDECCELMKAKVQMKD